MKRAFKILLYILLAFVLIIIGIVVYKKATHDPNWHVEQNAIKSETHPLAGFWKEDGCSDSWGLAIGPAGEGQYYISFCGPGGCFAENTYRPNTTIKEDPKYSVTNENYIEVWSKSGWSTYTRCPGRT